jgi:hypothetical protein
MRLKELEAELEATRKKIAEQLSLVGKSIQSIDPTLYDKEEVLEQALADAHTDAEMVVMIEDIAYAFLENKGNLTNYWKTYNLNEREQRDVRQYLDARLRERNDAHLDAPLVEDAHVPAATITLQEVLAEYKD